jgi:hypothetical protein
MVCAGYAVPLIRSKMPSETSCPLDSEFVNHLRRSVCGVQIQSPVSRFVRQTPLAQLGISGSRPRPYRPPRKLDSLNWEISLQPRGATMFLYYGKTFESSRAGGCIVGVVCDRCGRAYYYELARIGTGAHTAPYGIGSSRASQKAQDHSESDLQRRLAMEAELVPCPRCHWISEDLVEGYRLGRYRGVGKLAFAVGFAGSILSLIVAWFIHIGSPLDRWLLPYLLIGGPATFTGIAMTLLLLRRWLRSRIQPNRGFPQETRLPPGTPPALIMDEVTQSLRVALPTSAQPDHFLDYQFGRHKLPPLCSECLQPSDEGRGFGVQVTRLIHFEIPRCAACAEKSDREWGRISRFSLLLVLLIGAAMVVLMVRASVELWIILVSSLVLFGATLVFISIVANARTAPVKLVGRDRSRGLVRLRFRNPAYVEAVTRQFDDLAQRN